MFKTAFTVVVCVGSEYLHDLQNDPNELINLAGNAEYRALRKQMRERTDTLAEEDYAKAWTATVSP